MIDDRGWPPPIFTEEGAFEKYLDRIFGTLEEGGPGSGWFAPPKGTHVSKKERGKTDSELCRAHALDIVDSSREQLIVYEDGKETFRTTGGAERVGFDTEGYRAAKDAVAIHNHPTEPGSFSEADIDYTIDLDLAEVQMVCRENGTVTLYHMERPEGGWPESHEFLLAIIDNSDKAKQSADWLVRQEGWDEERADGEYWHFLWEDVSDDLGIRYWRETL